jgi:hypothetical protein
MRRAVALLVALTLSSVLAACGGGGGGHHGHVVLDGSPRHYDVEGVMTKASPKGIVVDGHAYALVDDIEVFSSSTLKPVSLVSRINQYVQVGLRGHKAAWVALYSAVLRLPNKPAVAFHIGTLERVKDGDAVFQDGSVLRLKAGVRPTVKLPAQMRADIDVARHYVGALTVVSD